MLNNKFNIIAIDVRTDIMKLNSIYDPILLLQYLFASRPILISLHLLLLLLRFLPPNEKKKMAETFYLFFSILHVVCLFDTSYLYVNFHPIQTFLYFYVHLISHIYIKYYELLVVIAQCWNCDR